jgi:hypothetical protein
MVVYLEPPAAASLRGRVRVGEVAGSGNVNALAHSKIGDRELREALAQTLQLAEYSSADAAAASVVVSARIVGLDNSDADRGLMVTSRIRYVVTAHDAATPLLDEIVAARCTVRLAEAPIASARLEQATECSVAKNIAALLWRLRALTLAPPPVPDNGTSQDTPAGVTVTLVRPAPALARRYLAALYVTKVAPLARNGDRVMVALDGVTETITRDNADALARRYAEQLADVHAEAIRRGGLPVDGVFALNRADGCRRLGLANGRAWIEQRGPAILLDVGDRELNEGIAVGKTIAVMRAITGPDGWLVGTLIGDRIELAAGDCSVTLTPTR